MSSYFPFVLDWLPSIFSLLSAAFVAWYTIKNSKQIEKIKLDHATQNSILSILQKSYETLNYKCNATTPEAKFTQMENHFGTAYDAFYKTAFFLSNSENLRILHAKINNAFEKLVESKSNDFAIDNATLYEDMKTFNKSVRESIANEIRILVDSIKRNN